jgi:hypothetical protein
MAHYSAQVPKQLYGYSLQFTECVRALLEAKGGSRVSVEVFEDVGVQDDGVETDAIQVKSGSGANPLTDNSIDLWKTIRNWIDQCNCLLLNPVHTSFTIYVNSKAKGKLCTCMSAATDLPSAQLAVARIRETFTDKRNGKLKGTLSHELKRHLNIVLDPDNDTLLTLIINNFSHRSGSGSSYVDLLTAFKQHPINDGYPARILFEAFRQFPKPSLICRLQAAKGLFLQPVGEQRNQYWLVEVGRRRLFQPFTPSSQKLSLAERR